MRSRLRNPRTRLTHIDGVDIGQDDAILNGDRDAEGTIRYRRETPRRPPHGVGCDGRPEMSVAAGGADVLAGAPGADDRPPLLPRTPPPLKSLLRKTMGECGRSGVEREWIGLRSSHPEISVKSMSNPPVIFCQTRPVLNDSVKRRVPQTSVETRRRVPQKSVPKSESVPHISSNAVRPVRSFRAWKPFAKPFAFPTSISPVARLLFASCR